MSADQVTSNAGGALGSVTGLLQGGGLGLFLARSLLEVHLTEVHDSGGDLVNVVLFLLAETKNVEGILYMSKVFKMLVKN